MIILKDRKSIQLIGRFYFNMVYMITESIDYLGRLDFKSDHESVVAYILETKVPIEMPYIALYFSVILTINVKGSYD
jgi:hypothetical protein